MRLMKRCRRALAVCALALALSGTARAGVIWTGYAPPPPLPGEIHTGATSQPSSGTEQSPRPGEIQGGLAGHIETPLSAALPGLLQGVLALF